ncbi:MAG: 50S ribosomal protein L11 methyltransferase [Verrucomicrobia bacterium]|nr:50S ribosomal protein L11 methyltransferase [Verrucomicrobiota bacterium]
MKFHLVFRVKSGSNAEEAVGELCGQIDDIYEMQNPETGVVQIAGYSESETAPGDLTHCILEEIAPVEEIDWQKQWTDFAPKFHDGFAHIDLETLGGPVLLLKPGAGFGDLSHPTTRLALALMAPLVWERVVFDIGCGSGILSIAAVLLGAKKAYGIDIDNEAIAHSRENAAANKVETKVFFSNRVDPEAVPSDSFVIAFNMIESEQKTAWQSVPPLHSKKSFVVASGILSSQKDSYLSLTKSWGWVLIEEREEEGWAGFIFKQTI